MNLDVVKKSIKYGNHDILKKFLKDQLSSKVDNKIKNVSLTSRLSDNSEKGTTVQNIYKIDKFIEVEANKTRVLISEKDFLKIDRGKRDGDELILCGYGQGWEARVDMHWMDRKGNISKGFIFNVDQTMHFWWSEKEDCWLDVSTYILFK